MASWSDRRWVWTCSLMLYCWFFVLEDSGEGINPEQVRREKEKEKEKEGEKEKEFLSFS